MRGRYQAALLVLLLLCSLGMLLIYYPTSLLQYSQEVLGLNFSCNGKETSSQSKFPLVYQPSSGCADVTSGTPFSVDSQLLSRLGLPPHRFKSFNSSSVRDFVFVAGASADHFRQSQVAVSSVQEYFPDRKLFYYDIGLEKNQKKEVQTWCQVEVVDFRFEDYPDHVKNLHTYAFKPLIVQDMLRKVDSLVWVDSSVDILTSNWSWAYEAALLTNGFSPFLNTGISNYATTNPGMYLYLPTNHYTYQFAATAFLLHHTESIYWGLLHWWYLCALERDCIAPPDHTVKCTGSNFLECRRKGKPRCWARCHRYDQSALNVLLANYLCHQRNHGATQHLASISKDLLRRQSYDKKLPQVKRCRRNLPQNVTGI